MSDLLQALKTQAGAMTALELVAVLLAVAYLVLVIRQNIWCWVCAAVSTTIFTYLFFDVALYMESGLNIFYFAMALYGWYQWRYGGGRGAVLAITTWPWQIHAVAAAALLAITWMSGSWLAANTDAAFPYLDSFTSWAAVWATFLVARKVFENWWYWLLIDILMVYVFWVKDLQLTSLLYVLYVLLIPVGMLHWRRSMQEQAHEHRSG